MKSLVSVIVPIYDVERYIEKCINSILNQTYKNLEIILVDDGSPDNCPQLCDSYAKKDKRIKVIHKQNGGLSSARNAGLDILKGEFVVFVDSDDSIECNMIEELLRVALEENADVVQCGFQHLTNDNLVKCSFKHEYYKLNSKEDILEFYFKYSKIYPMVWCKIYKSELFSTIRMIENKNNEDYMVTPEILLQINKFVNINKILYNYTQNSNSIMNSKFNNKKMDRIYAANYVIKLCQSKIQNHVIDSRIYMCMACIYLYDELLFNNSKESRNYKENILSNYHKNYRIINKSNEFKKTRIQNKVLIKTFNFNRFLTIILYRLFKKIKYIFK